jgi:MYXO-CTERM domain-containing protein
VVIEAANDAGGQGFVTEMAGDTSTLKSAVWTQFDDQNWNTFQKQIYMSFDDMFFRAYGQYGAWDGFWDATRASVTLPTGLAFEDFKLCPNCYAGQIQFQPAAFLAELQRTVIDPVKLVQNLIDAHPKLTRMYTTLSADEMTVDPVFSFNADLDDLSNVHTAERVIECNPSIYEYEAPWRIELPQGGVVRGNATDVGTWPAAFNTLPSNNRIVRTGTSGAGKVVEDNSAPIASQLDDYNASIVPTKPGGSAGATGSAGAIGNNASPNAGGGGGCAIAPPTGSWELALAALALGTSLLRRRRQS